MNGQLKEKIAKLITEAIDSAQAILIENLQQEADKYSKEYELPLDTQQSKNKYLAHYTSIDTLHSIIKNPEGLWLCDASYVNDPSEGKYLKKILAKEHKWLNDARLDTDAFLCSFLSGKEKDIGNKVTFWQSSYGHDGLGCSIQIPLYLLNKEMTCSCVKYGEEKIEDIKIKFKVYFELANKIRTKLQKDGAKDTKDFITKFWKAFDSIKFLHKDRGYEYEEEYRRIKIPRPDDDIKEKFNKTHPFLKKYMLDDKLSSRKILTTGITVFIGPRVFNKKKLCEYFKKMAHNEKLYGPTFKTSKIPYRSIS